MRVVFLLLALISPPVFGSDWIWELDEQMHRLGKAEDPEWDEYRDVASKGLNLNSIIPRQTNGVEWTLFIRQRDVKLAWSVVLNGRTLTNLFVSEDDLVNA